MTRKLLYILLTILCFPPAGIGQHKIDSLLSLIKSDKQDTNKVLHLIGVSFQYYLQSDDNKAILTEDSAIAIATRLNFQSGYAKACCNMGSFYTELEQYSKAWNFFSLSLKAYEKLNDKKGYALLKNDLGEFYYLQDNYPKALDYFLDALNLEKETGDEIEVANVMGNIGVAYWRLGEYDKALDYNTKALEIYRHGADKYNMATTLGNIGIVYGAKKDFDKELMYDKQALALETETGDKQGIARNNLNIAIVYNHKEEFSAALGFDQTALKLYEEIEDKKGIELAKENIGSVYFNEKKYKDAESYYLQAYTSAKEIGNLNVLSDVCKNLSTLYDTTGQAQKALDFYKQYIVAQDSLINENRSKEIGHIEAKAEYEKQLELQKAEEDAKAALSKAESKRQKLFSLLVAAIALVAILLAFNIFRLLKTTRKQKLIAEKQKVLQELKTLRAQMNPHFIFNAINSIKNVVLENDSAAASKHLSTFSKLMREVLENSKHESIPLAKELQMLTLYMDLESLRFSSKFTYSISVDSSINPENVLISPLIIQPYVENAIWHGLMHLQTRKGELAIRVEDMHNGMMKCTIDDNGIGREKSAEAKKGRMYQSLGLSITQERLDIINSLYKSNISMQIIDKTNSDGLAAGTCVELILPIIANRTEHA